MAELTESELACIGAMKDVLNNVVEQQEMLVEEKKELESELKIYNRSLSEEEIEDLQKRKMLLDSALERNKFQLEDYQTILENLTNKDQVEMEM